MHREMFVKNKKLFLPCMIGLLVLQLVVIMWFCVQKQGYHYDEYYSYYSSNVTYALVPTDMEWKDTSEIRSEFMVMEGEGLGFGMVKLMQSLDVHPPLYYYLLRIVCFLSEGIFSKWQGLSINILFFVLSWLTLAALTKEITNNDKKKILSVCTLFGFSPAIFSGIMFIRMYMMLTFVCLLILYIHVRAVMRQKRTWKGFYLPVCLLSFIGFHIHYYFAVFLFFLAAAVSLYLFFHKGSRKESFLYAGSVLAGLAVSVLAYPACLKHIFRGYRGTEAQDAFFDLSNIDDRLSFFFDLTNEYVFGNMLVVLLLCLIVLGLTRHVKRNFVSQAKRSTVQNADRLMQQSQSTAAVKQAWSPRKQAVLLTLFVTLGYFLVVAKTALMNAEEAIRYEMPVYGLLILLVVIEIGEFLEEFETERNRKWLSAVFAGLMLLTLAGEAAGLANGKVCFLYPEDKENTAWAAEHKEDAAAYIYNPSNQWMIWDDSEELMQYEQIYFVSSEREELLADERLSREDTVYVYAMRGENSEEMLQKLIAENGGFSKVQLIRELLYCDLYELSR